MKAFIIFSNMLFEKLPGELRGSRVIIFEDPLFFRQYRFHKKKLMLHRASMKFYKEYLRGLGISVEYRSTVEFPKLALLFESLNASGVREVTTYELNDYLLERRLRRYCEQYGMALHTIPYSQFLSSEPEIRELLGEKKHYLMAGFYQKQRKRLDILMSGNEPVGGKWSFDEDNRKKLPNGLVPPPPLKLKSNRFVEEAATYVNIHFSANPGTTSSFNFPVTFDDAREVYDDFLLRRSREFGIYEDAIHSSETWLYHSVLTPALNVGLLTPEFVVNEILERAPELKIPLNSLEGFIRQIIGWREFMRGIYIIKGVEQRKSNFFGHTRPIPDSFYTGTTGITPVDDSINKLLNHAYTHHIERLMILGNFMLLGGFEPDGIYQWFMEMYIDSYDWVMVPNVYGMSQYADGGLITTKPYISGSNYILKMSNYSKGNWCPVWDGLYWSFIHRHFNTLKQNQRMSMVVNLLQRMDREKLKGHLEVAGRFLDS
ncbi:MAG: cryptochrome/photolyase family protein [Ignavibacteriaceae bacterium]|nr:MAG: cryptochrome/photolyase family protein [Ignavibacteriaceae bacterium]